MNFLKWDCVYASIFSLMILAIKFAVSQTIPAMECSLEFQNLSNGLKYSSCIKGNWGGYLRDEYCGTVFHSYLRALGQRAKRTGLIYLNVTEQKSCLSEMRKSEQRAFCCGFEKLTTGHGGCSDFSIANVTEKLVEQLTGLTENCKLNDSDGGWPGSCSSCIKSWWKMRELTHESSVGILKPEQAPELSNAEADICRFAVLVTLTSNRTDDMAYVQRLYSCLAQDSNLTAPPDDHTSDGKRRASISTGTYTLIGGSVSVIIIMIAIMMIILRKCRNSKASSKKHAFKELQLHDSCCPRFTIKEVYSATKNLSERNLIGEGTAGKVYKGVLSNSQAVAIKHIINDGNVETVIREVKSLSHVKHPNLVALLGYCARGDQCFLIYELCPNGNLSEWLFGKNCVLSWVRRLEIAIDSACGLWFLHIFPGGCIVHRDIKPTNVLLGANFEAKLSDFGLSKVIDLGETHANSEVRGTFGYVDPKYQNNCQVNSSGDVYSFGIVLLQILSGKRVVNMNLNEPMPLDKMAKRITKGGSIAEFADPKLEGEYSAEAFDLTFRLALSCTSLKQRRPSMDRVVAILKEALDISTRAKASTPETTPDRLSSL